MTLDEECADLYRRSRQLYLRSLSGQPPHFWLAAAKDLHAQIRRDHGCELYYEVELPSIFRLIHPLGTVLGRASYADHFVAYQNCSVGSDVDGGRPTFTGPCVLFPGARVLGNVVVGANVWITAGTKLEARPGQTIEIEPYSVVFQMVGAKAKKGLFEHHIVHATRRTTRSVVERYFSNNGDSHV